MENENYSEPAEDAARRFARENIALKAQLERMTELNHSQQETIRKIADAYHWSWNHLSYAHSIIANAGWNRHTGQVDLPKSEGWHEAADKWLSQLEAYNADIVIKALQSEDAIEVAESSEVGNPENANEALFFGVVADSIDRQIAEAEDERQVLGYLAGYASGSWSEGTHGVFLAEQVQRAVEAAFERILQLRPFISVMHDCCAELERVKQESYLRNMELCRADVNRFQTEAELTELRNRYSTGLIMGLQRLGNEYGPFGVAKAAAELTDKDVLVRALTANRDEAAEDEAYDATEPLDISPDLCNYFDHYQMCTRSTAEYPEAGTGMMGTLNYVLMALGGEVGSMQNKFKKILRGDYGSSATFRAYDPGSLSENSPVRQALEKIDDELGDVLWYIARYADERGNSLSEIASQNLRKLSDRASRGLIKGTGSER